MQDGTDRREGHDARGDATPSRSGVREGVAGPSCPNCSQDLRPRSCKMRCPRCGDFEDCGNLI